MIIYSLVVLSTSFGNSLADIGPAPVLRLLDHESRTFELDDRRGSVVVVSFLFTTCNGTCPMTTAALYQTQETLKKGGLWGDRVSFVSVTLDPERDSADVLSKYARTYGADTSRWKFLTGTAKEISQTLKAWDMWAKLGPTGVLDHPSRLFLIDPRGRIREIYSLEFLKPSAVIQDIKTLLNE